jgi:hypothetical protein
MAKRRLVALTVALLGAVGTLTACSGGAPSSTPTTTTAVDPGANIDPSAGGAVAGPINAAKRAADAEDHRTQDLEEKISGTP